MKKYREFMSEKDALHGSKYGHGIKGKDEKKQADAFDRNIKKYKDNPNDKSAFEPTAIDKKVMKKREKGEMPPAPKSKHTEGKGPCWDGYKQVGMKNKGGKQVPNCVPEEVESVDEGLFDFNPRKKILDPSMFSSKKDDISQLITLQQKALAMKPGDSKRTAIFKEINKVKQRLGIAEEVLDAVTDMFLEDCWDGYKQVGMKKKGGKQVPNCVPEENELEENDKALANKAKESGEPLGDLKKVYKRGLAAYASGHRPGMTQHQWAMARVNSYIKGGKARTVDKDIRESAKAKLKVKARSVKANIGVRG